MKLIYVLLVLVLLSCKRDELYYELPDDITVKVALDWSNSDITPNGVTALIYYSSGELYRQYPLFSVTDTLTFVLPEGEYDIVMFNDSEGEHSYLEFTGKDHVDSLEVSTIEVSSKSSDNITVENPDFLATSRLDGVSVSATDKDYYKTPNYSVVNTETKYYSSTMTRRVYNYYVNVYVEGINYAASYPSVIFEHLSGGYLIGQEKVDGSLVKHTFSMETLTYTTDDKTEAEITATFSNFGLLSTSGVTYLMDVSFTLIDGSTFTEVFDITEQISEENVSRSVTVVDKEISVSTSLPEAIGGDSSDGSSFETAVDPWQEVEQTLAM